MKLNKLRVENCCGCCDLRTGTLVVGILGLLFSIGGLITHTVALDEVEDPSFRTKLKLFIGYSYLFLAINGLLLYGALKESRYFLLPWLVYVGSGVGIVTLISIIFMFFVPAAILILLFCVAVWYKWICVWSYFMHLNPTNLPSNLNIYSESGMMAPSVVTYEPQPPSYPDINKGPVVL